MPACGFSMLAVQILKAEGVSFNSLDCLKHPFVAAGAKVMLCVAWQLAASLGLTSPRR